MRSFARDEPRRSSVGTTSFDTMEAELLRENVMHLRVQDFIQGKTSVVAGSSGGTADVASKWQKHRRHSAGRGGRARASSHSTSIPVHPAPTPAPSPKPDSTHAERALPASRTGTQQWRHS